MVLDMILIWFGNTAVFSGSVGLEKGNRNSPGTGFWSISRGFLWVFMVLVDMCFLNVILVWFEKILIRF